MRQRPHVIDPAANHAQVFYAAQQSDLDGLGRHVLRQRSQLCVQQFGGYRLKPRHAHRVLRGDGGHRRAAVHTAKRDKGLEVGLQACAATAVGPRNAPNDRPRTDTITRSIYAKLASSPRHILLSNYYIHSNMG